MTPLVSAVSTQLLSSDTVPVYRLRFGQWTDSFVDWFTTFFASFFDVVKIIFVDAYEGLDWVLTSPPFWVIGAIFIAISIWFRGWLFGAGALVGLAFIYLVAQWDNAMHTIALTLVATVISVIISIPLGIWMARSSTVATIFRPILDFLQTMPAFVYLIPAIILFSTGPAAGIVATILFAVAPGVRMTELGIREVDKEVVEAGYAFGASPGRILRQIQLPLARPSIMAGVNQIIMLSLSMVVIASMVGTPGLGVVIYSSFSTIDVGLGAEGGLGIVIVAILLDRVTAALGTGRTHRLLPRREEQLGSVPAAPGEETQEAQTDGENVQVPVGA